MERRWQRSRAIAAGTAVSITALCATWVPAFGQEDGGALFTLGLSSTLDASDNVGLDTDPTDSTLQLETDLTLGIQSITRTQTLRFSLSDSLRAGVGDKVDTGLRGPDLALSYDRQAANAQLSLSAGQTTREVDGQLTDEDLDDPDALIVDSGTLFRTTLGFGLKTGLQRPFGTEFALSRTRRSYAGTTDPDLDDSRTRSGSAAFVLRPDTVTEARLTYAITELEQDDAESTERTTRSLGIGASRQLSPVVAINGALGWTEITEDQTALSRSLPDNGGLTAVLGYARDLPAGKFATDLSRDITSAGGRTDLSITRSFAFAAQSVEITFGVTKPDGGDLQPTGRLAYARNLADQQFGVAFSTDIAVDADSDIQRETSVDANYRLTLNQRDSLGFDIDYARRTGLGRDTTDRTRASAAASYRRNLTADWSLSARLAHRLSRDTDADTARSNTAAVTLGREFSWRP